MTFLAATLCFITFGVLVKEAISASRLRTRVFRIAGSLLSFLLGVIYTLIFLIEIFLE